MASSRNLSPLGRCLFVVAMLVELRAVSGQTFRFPKDATPTEFQGFVTSAPGSESDRFLSATNIPNCYTMTIYQSYPSAALSWSAIGCVQPGFDASTVYREIVVGTTTTAPPGSSTGTGRERSSTAVETGTRGSTISSTVVETSTGESSNTWQPDSPASQAWIAGAVIGPVAAVIFAALLAFWLGKRKGRREVPGGVPRSDFGNHDFESATMQSTMSPLTVKSELADITNVAELADHRTVELDSHPVRSNGTGRYMNKGESSW
ncbi:predicted protein [Chaetomium globosum CBS 148.51]|uniref:Mid2 domain-containing protein n=1 Tax=Chaetomium globosum (strain ATCC 6205 / CBS 148.51 / DSM 1962 / NBRC 6347 / NRRL 1970) TaxID=306901 RepID=Q2GUQ3_CHAGB|nr:uncharacterized protein CHGG_08301 [Chaetomium globosum CBS 148.51]EAQ87048.1 predicted protein [Chaetomium globosum CBS 148.51]